jgi:hypothetical protein
MSFPAAARKTLQDAQLRRNLGKATSTIRAKRLAAIAELDDWEALREAGAAIKARTMATLPDQLERLEASVQSAGGVVHWARDAAEANGIVAGIAREHGAREVIKVKSIATDEIGLNEALAGEGVTAIETDLAELIIQLAHEQSTHILVPAIHRTAPRSSGCSSARSRRARTSGGRRARSPRRRGATCGRSSSPCRWRSRARTSGSPRPARSPWSSPRATAACARRCPRCW